MGRHTADGSSADGAPSGARHDTARADTRRPRRRGWVLLTLVVVAALVAGGVVWATVLRDSGPDCPTRTDISIAADPSMTSALKAVAPQASADSCYDFAIAAASGARIPGELTRGDQAPDLWVADSTGRATTVTKQVGVPTDIVVPSVAASPAVVAGTAVPALANWVEVMKLPDLRIGSPLDSSTGDAPIVGALAAVEKGTLTDKEMSDAMTILAIQQGNLRADDDSEANRLALANASATPVVTTEQEFVAFTRANPTTKLKASIPSAGTTMLDYPMLVTAPAARRDVARTAGEEFARALRSQAGTTALNAAGYRDPAATPLTGVGVGQVSRIALKDPSQEEKTLRQWSVLAVPIRTLVAMDVSGSMDEAVGDTTRADLLVQAALTGNKLFPNNTEIGMWYFSIDKGGPGQDWVEIAPIAREDSVRPDGTTQRAFLNQRADDYRQYVGGGTGLYDTTLAAFQKVQESYDPNYSNSVIILTDGRNEDPDSISLQTLLGRIQELQDPARPVLILTIGISDDADTAALKQIADATPGGTSYVAQDPRDIPTVLIDAVQARVAAAGR
ncbi:substrate-binding domain-containing protein [Williamsia maris]|uniref:ABC-type molybdate transport system, substrate-binding protein n=1 Tax=Williamsia maris TaxID=72806 RepID=A0ABT1H8W6_9NOCA|nr:substrate-binding domain-containing protein [Williamsia maris]MCP2174696.1 ABC-type molybdate transport system, substrate-binding protein [Williamsia maris]